MNQDLILLEHLKRGRVLTPLLAFSLVGSMACHSNIARIRKMGYIVNCTIRSSGKKRWGEYSLELPSEQIP